MSQGGATYADAGVDIAAGDAAVERLRGMVSGIGGFGGQFPLDVSRYTSPVLVSSTDGVGTKLVVARATGRYETVGIDLVAMCVDDLVCVGAEPLFMLDYLATGKVVPETVATVVAGVHEGCRQAGCALIGGETAEHAGVMAADEIDLAGFAVGVVEQGSQLGPERVRAGRRRGRSGLARLAFQRLHLGAARAARARRARPRRARLGGSRTQRGRRAPAALRDLHPGRAGRARPTWARPFTPAPTSPAAGSSGTCPASCPTASAPRSIGPPGTSRGSSPRSSTWATWPKARWTASSTGGSGWRWWWSRVGPRTPCRHSRRRGNLAGVIGTVTDGPGVHFS